MQITAGRRGGNGVSNWGVIKVNGSCLTFISEYALVLNQFRLLVLLNRVDISNIMVRS